MRIEQVEQIAAELGRHSCRVVTTVELVAAKVDMSVVAALVRAGRWTVLWRGVYLCSSSPVTPVVRAHAALKYAGTRGPTHRPQPRPLVTGLAGCAALEMRWLPKHTRVQVLVGPEVQRRSNESVLVRRTWDVEAVESWNWAGVAVAEATRLVVDGARECASLQDVRGLALGAIADGMTSPSALSAVLDAGATAKTAWLRRAVLDATRGATSPPEAEVVDALIGLGLPFLVNPEIWLDGVLVAVFDIYLLGTGVGGEVDSSEWHGSSVKMSATLQRHERVSAVELSLAHTTPTAFRADPDAYVARLVAAVESRRARGLTEPPGLEIRPRGPVLR